jgi:hypothetical protein
LQLYPRDKNFQFPMSLSERLLGQGTTLASLDFRADVYVNGAADAAKKGGMFKFRRHTCVADLWSLCVVTCVVA